MFGNTTHITFRLQSALTFMGIICLRFRYANIEHFCLIP